MADKTPLHSVVSVICDVLAELTPAEQTRTLEAVRIALGLRAYPAPTQLVNTASTLMIPNSLEDEGMPIVTAPSPGRRFQGQLPPATPQPVPTPGSYVRSIR